MSTRDRRDYEKSDEDWKDGEWRRVHRKKRIALRKKK